MTTLFVITVLLLAVSLFYNWYFWRLAKLWKNALLRERRGLLAERLGMIAGALLVPLVLRVFSNREE